MFTDEIEVILQRALSANKTKFLGVFAQDRVPALDSLTQFPCCLVANTAPISEAGTHWVAFFLESSSHVEFFDSYGLHPSCYQLPTPANLLYNTHPFQSLSSDVCGHYSIYFLHQRSHKQTLHSITSHLNSLGPCADRYVRTFVAHLIASIYLTLPPKPRGQSCKSKSSQ